MDIRISRLVLENFKCHRYLSLELEGDSACLYGDNAAGKTSVYDGFTWLLFGKDSAGNGEKGLSLKPLNHQGEVADHRAVTAVEGVLTADGRPITLRRTLREIWTVRRGSEEPVFEGNTSEYFVDGVPCRKFLYDEKIRELVSEELFRMLTSVRHFLSDMKWQERRAVLFDMAGSLTDRELMASRSQFAPLAQGMGQLTMEAYRGKLLRQKRGLTGQREVIPARLDECRRILAPLARTDFTVLRQQEQLLLQRKARLEEALKGLRGEEPLELTLRERRLALDTWEEKNRRYRQEQRPGPDRDALLRELSHLEEAQAAQRQEIARQEKALDSLREACDACQSQAFTGTLCPACGRALPLDRLQEALRRFREQKEEQRKALEDRIRETEEALAVSRSQAAQSESQGKALRQALQALEQARTEETPELPGYREARTSLLEEIRSLEEAQARRGADTQSLDRELTAVRRELSQTRQLLAQEKVLRQTQARIDQLQAEEVQARRALERVEDQLYRMEEFTRFKASQAEEAVNGLFRLARFRLFREQANGGLEERCDAQFQGVPYSGLNSAMRVNLGIDVIDALSRYYGVSVPLFIDNGESVTQLEQRQGQVIRLVVSREDAQLRLERC